MIPIILFILASFSIFSIGIAGIVVTRHFILMIVSIEVALVASTLLATTFYYFDAGSGDIMLLLFALWSVAAVEAIALIAFYRYIAKYEASLDVTRLSKLRD